MKVFKLILVIAFFLPTATAFANCPASGFYKQENYDTGENNQNVMALRLTEVLSIKFVPLYNCIQVKDTDGESVSVDKNCAATESVTVLFRNGSEVKFVALAKKRIDLIKTLHECQSN